MTDDHARARDRHRRRTHDQRAGDRCPTCGRPFDQAGVDVHHRDENPGNGHPENLRKRCPDCHLGGEHDRDVDRTGPSGPRRSRPSRPRTAPR